MAKLELEIIAGPTSKTFLESLIKLLDRMEKFHESTTQTSVTVTKQTATTDDEDESFEDEETPTPKKTTKKAVQASFDDDDFDGGDETEDEETPAPKKKKATKYTADDVNDACKAYAKDNGGGKDGRDAVLKLLKKNFKTTTITALEPDDYAKAIKLLEI